MFIMMFLQNSPACFKQLCQISIVSRNSVIIKSKVSPCVRAVCMGYTVKSIHFIRLQRMIATTEVLVVPFSPECHKNASGD